MIALTGNTVLAETGRQRFVEGQVLIKFLTETTSAKVVSEASATVPIDKNLLAEVLRQLSEKSGIPLRAEQITGGQWLLVAVNREKLENNLLDNLKTLDSIWEVKSSAQSSTTPTFFIQFRKNTWQYRAIDSRNFSAEQSIANELSKQLDVPLQARIKNRKTLQIQVDLKTLTLTLMRKLENATDVDKVQLNHILTIAPHSMTP